MESGTRRAAFLAAFALAMLLTGCSSSASDGSVEDAGGAEAPAAVEDESAPDLDRSVIITGSLYMTVDDPIAAADRASAIVQGAGGRIDARSETAADESYGGEAALTLRIPSAQLDQVVDDLRELGTVDEFSTDTTDVTVEVTDLEASISTLRASTQRIESLLAEAEDIADIIALEGELDSRRSELESLEAQQRGLDDQVSMSTILLSLTTEPVVIVDDSPDSFWDGLTAGWSSLVAFGSGAVVIVGVLLPWLALIALVTIAVVYGVRKWNARAARNTTDLNTMADSEADQQPIDS